MGRLGGEEAGWREVLEWEEDGVGVSRELDEWHDVNGMEMRYTSRNRLYCLVA